MYERREICNARFPALDRAVHKVARARDQLWMDGPDLRTSAVRQEHVYCETVKGSATHHKDADDETEPCDVWRQYELRCEKAKVRIIVTGDRRCERSRGLTKVLRKQCRCFSFFGGCSALDNVNHSCSTRENVDIATLRTSMRKCPLFSRTC